MANDIIVYENFFNHHDYEIITEYVNRDRWMFGHGSYPEDHPNFKNSIPFWGMNLDDETFFTEYLLNKIQEKTNQKFSLYTVYANGHTFGTRGCFHQDWYTPEGRTFLLYVNDWHNDWGGSTIFNVDNNYIHHYPEKNKALFFPGMIPHTADATNRSFTGLRITVAWKLILR